jgi:predicted nucleic acid-binding protein
MRARRRAQLSAAVLALTILPTVRVEDPAAVTQALEWATLGMNFADALHLASRGESTKFATFDEDLVKRAKALGAAGAAPLHV